MNIETRKVTDLIPYANVIVRRWQEHTGEVAILEGKDVSFDALAGID